MAPPKKKGYKGASSAAPRRVWKTGDLVLAKLKGHPWWPARVSDPDEFGYVLDRRKVFVYFFGTKQIGSVQPLHVKSFTSETKKNLLAKPQVKNTISDFSRAVKEICEASKGFHGRDDDVLPTSSNRASDTAIVEALEQEEVEQSEENADIVSASGGHTCGNDMLRGTMLGEFEREMRSRSSLNNGLETVRSAEKTKGLAFYESSKKRRKVVANKEELDIRISAAKHRAPPRRFSSRHARMSDASLPESLASSMDFRDQTGVHSNLIAEAECRVDDNKENDLLSFLDLPGECLPNGDADIIYHAKHSGSQVNQFLAASRTLDGIGRVDTMV